MLRINGSHEAGGVEREGGGGASVGLSRGRPAIGRLRRLPSVYLVLTALLWIKMALLRYFTFGEVAWRHVGADAAAVAALASLVALILPGRGRFVACWLFDALVSILLLAATLYFAHFGSMPTYTALLELNQVPQVQASVQSTMNPLYYLYFADLPVWAAARFVWRRRPAIRVASAANRRWLAAVALVVCAGIVATDVRQGLGIDNELAAADREGFLSYQVIAAIKANRESRQASAADLAQTVSEVDALQASFPYRNSANAGAMPAHFGEASGSNLIVLQLEAFQNFPLHLKVGGLEVTPVLNKLADESYYFPRVYQQIGQGNTSDAEFMANTSIYPTAKIAMSTGYGDRALPSLPRLLQREGYKAFTFHVNDVKFWDRNRLYPALHFDQYFDKPYYENDRFNEFGASDEELYRFGLEELTKTSAAGTPFYAQFVTASSHFPFKVPKDRQRLQVPDALEGTQLGDYLIAANYTDYAIGQLIEGLKKEGLWERTTLAVYGDHYGLQPDDNDPKWVSDVLGIKYDSRISRMNIPFIVHTPGQPSGKRVDQVGGQLDMMPTIANLLGKKPRDAGIVAFGHDLLNIDRNVVGSRYYLPTGSFFNDDVLYVPGTGFEDGKAVSLDTMEPVNDLSPYRGDYDYIMKLMGLSDRYVRLLPKR
ncbi:LTA synthase family protein [Cohnella sp. GbtcB17]|uniref:LTA synthase family protein n=1 Tax=Cohnella sp. GbtcB17 TaxID=2824762 RepID=UPI001C30DEA9|nr:LTA synthase family protein [Cohnella sp. GbtcB17]